MQQEIIFHSRKCIFRSQLFWKTGKQQADIKRILNEKQAYSIFNKLLVRGTTPRVKDNTVFVLSKNIGKADGSGG